MTKEVQEFKYAFENAVSIYDQLAASQTVTTADQDRAIEQLRKAYQSFCDRLYVVLESYDDWNTQTSVVYEGIRREIDNDRMFSDEFRDDHAVGFECAKIFGEIRKACWWFSDQKYYRLRYFRDNYSRGALAGVRNNVAPPIPNRFNTPVCQSDSVPQNKKEAPKITDFIIKDEDKVLKFIDDELKPCRSPQGKLIATMIVALCDKGYFAQIQGKVTNIIHAFRNAYPEKVAVDSAISDCITGYYNRNSETPKSLSKEVLEQLKNKLD